MKRIKKCFIFVYSFARSGDHAKEIGTNLCFTCPVVSTCWAFFILIMPRKRITYTGAERTKLFRENYPFYPIPKQSDTCICNHCMENYTFRDVQVNKSAKGDIWLMCRDYPDCDAGIIDIFKMTKDEIDAWRIDLFDL
jgi:hypothetical protein